jgi:ribosomal protein S8
VLEVLQREGFISVFVENKDSVQVHFKINVLGYQPFRSLILLSNTSRQYHIKLKDIKDGTYLSKKHLPHVNDDNTIIFSTTSGLAILRDLIILQTGGKCLIAVQVN